MLYLIKAITLAGRKALRPAVKACQKIKANKPEIFVGIGATIIVGSFFWVVAQAMKAPETMAETADKVKELEEKLDELKSITASNEDNKSYEAAIAKLNKDLRSARINGALQMVKLFSGPVILLVIGLGINAKGVTILRKNNVVLASALKANEEFIKFYRRNVIADQGKEADKRYASGIVGETEISTIEKDKDGNDILMKQKVPIVKGKGNPWQFEYSPTFFRSATGDAQTDIGHLIQIQDYFNHKYNGSKKYGKISMYEILDYLDPIWEAIDADGSVEIFARNYGYGHDPRGDNLIDLGVYRAVNEAAVRGYGDAVWIEFNCDGNLKNLKNQYKEKYRTCKNG